MKKNCLTLKKIIFSFIIIYSFYSALKVEIGPDTLSMYALGFSNLNYFFHFSLEKYFKSAPSFYMGYQGLYNVFSALIVQIISLKFKIQILHLVNLIFFIFSALGIYRISKIIFNKDIATIVFIFYFFNPSLFGFSFISERDIPLVFSLIFFLLYSILYLKNQHLKKNKKYIFWIIISLLVGLSVRIFFAGIILIVFLFLLLDIFFLKKITSKSINLKKLVLDIFFVFFLTYFILILSWPAAHENIIFKPFELVFASQKIAYGWPHTMLNGEIFKPHDYNSFTYLPLVIFFNLPEYIIFLYGIFLVLIFNISFRNYILKYSYFLKFLFFFYLFFYFLFFLNFYPVYEDMRLFLFLLPFLNFIPAITIYYLMSKRDVIYKYSKYCFFLFFIYYIFFFFSLNPYQYVYKNLFAGSFDNLHNKFENDYWALSVNELFNWLKFHKSMSTNLHDQFDYEKYSRVNFCGVIDGTAKYYLSKNIDIKFIHDKINFDYVIMVNRVDWTDPRTCFEKYKDSEKLLEVKRRGLTLSSLIKIKKNVD